MPDAKDTVEMQPVEVGRELAHLTLLLANNEARFTYNGNSGRVVSSVLQTL